MFERFGTVAYCPHTKVEGFVEELAAGRLSASRCLDCDATSFPPRADCPACRGDAFGFEALSGRGTVTTYTRIEAAPAGFEEIAPYVVGVVDLEETGRLLAWFGDSIAENEIAIGMAVQVVPRRLGDGDDARIHYTLERAGA